MLPNDELPTTSVLLIDGHANDRTSFANQLKRCSPDYTILEAVDRQSGLDLYRQSQRIDCVIHEIDLPDASGFQLLVDLIPVAKRPTVAVIILTRLSNQALWEVAKKNGAYVCLFKPHTSGDHLGEVIQRAIGWVGLMAKEDQHQPI